MKEALTGNYAFWLNGRIAMYRSNNHFSLLSDDDGGVYAHVANAKGYNTKMFKAAFASIEVWNGKKRKNMHESDIIVHWLDDYSACIKMPETSRNGIAAWFQEGALVSHELGDVTFTPWSDWLRERKDANQQGLSRAIMKQLTYEADEPSRKRVKTTWHKTWD